jgi:hypothetical protein
MEIIAVYTKNHKGPQIQNAQLLIVKAGGTYSSYCSAARYSKACRGFL